MHTTNNKVIHPKSFFEYRDFILNMSSAGTCSGEQNEERIEATKINAHRTKRIYNTFIPRNSTTELLSQLNSNWDWILLTETWCGDGAQNVPIIAKIAELNPLIRLTIALRDENDAIMSQHLTAGARAIPKLICFESSTMEFIGEWGPRPFEIGAWVKEFKRNNLNFSHDDFVKQLHLLYAKDKGSSLERELCLLIEKWMKS